MGKLPWMQFFPADFLLDTQLLSLSERGAWIDILCHLWRADPRGRLTYPLSTWAALLRCTETDVTQTCNALQRLSICVVAFESNGDVTLASRRIEREEKTRNSTRLRVAKHRGNDACNGASNGSVTGRSQNQKSEVIYQKSEQKEEFEVFWSVYPRKIGKKAALKSWSSAKDKPPIDRILAAVRSAMRSPDWIKDNGKFIPHPATWLNQGRWADEYTVPAPRKERLPL